MRGMNKKYSHDNEFHINHNNNNNMATTETISVFSGNLFIGLCLSVLATLMNSTGMNLQRYSKTKDRPCLNVIGIILSTACGLVDMCSFHFAPQSLLAPVVTSASPKITFSAARPPIVPTILANN